MAAHRDDSPGAHLFGRKQAEQANRTITYDGYGPTALHVGGDCREPSGAHHVGKGQQAGNEVIRRKLGGGDQRTVGEWNAHPTCLRAADELAVLA